METSFQGTIMVENGKIRNISNDKDFVQIDANEKSYFFGNAFALPGFSDSHGHIASLGSKLNGLNFSNCESSEECSILALNKAHKKGSWIVGSGWNNELWKNNVFPNKKILDTYFPKTPVCFTRVDGHAAWVNTTALKLADITKFTKNPLGGLIEKDKSGNPTGILHDNAIDLIKNIIPKYSISQLKENIQSALIELVSYGITSVHDMDVNPELIDIYRTLDNEKKLPLRIYSFVSGQKDEWFKNNIKPESNNMFSVVGVKFYADGSLGSRSAAMLEDYSDAKGKKGIFLIDEIDLYRKTSKAILKNLDVAVHAIGDAANKMVLNVFNNILKNNVVHSEQKLRVEHAQHVHPTDIVLFNDSRIIASIQPVHCISDAATISEKRLGERCSYAYPWKSLLENGGNLICGSDFPIESHNPLKGIDALTKRIPFGESKPWFKKEIVDIETAVNSYTCYPQSAISSDLLACNLKEGFFADIVILDKDIFTCSDVKKIKVLATFVNGERVF